MDRNQVITLGAIVLVVIAGLLWFKPFGAGEGSFGDNNANLPDGAWYQCGDAACKHDFNLTVKQLDAHYTATYGQPRTQPPCPKCGKTDSIRSDRCVHCGKLSPQNRNTQACVHCGQNATVK